MACRGDKKIGLTRAVKAAEVLHAGCVKKGERESTSTCRQNMNSYADEAT
jgi:hypothetical protein